MLEDNEIDDVIPASAAGSSVPGADSVALGGTGEGGMENSGIRNATISVGKEKYAVGLFWQPLQDPEDAQNEARETAETLSDGADLYCVRSGPTPQYALGVSGDIKAGMKVAAAAVADAFADKPSSVAVFKVEEGWWFLALRSDLILAEDDRLFADEKDAKQAFLEMMAVPDWGRKIAPPEWKMEGTSYIELEDILRRSSSLKLSKIGSGKGMKNMVIMGAVLALVLFGIYELIGALTKPPPPPVFQPLPPIDRKPAPVVKPEPEEPPPWLSLNDPVDILNKCQDGVRSLETVSVPGWTKMDIYCNVTADSGSLSSEWKRADGRISWFSGALDQLGLKKQYSLSVSENGDSGRISSGMDAIAKINSPPTLARKDIRLEFIDIFDAIGVPIALSAATEGEIRDPNNPSAPARPRYFLVKYKFTTEFAPDTWVNVLSQFKALTVENIKYNVENKVWSYEGKIYERRI